MTSGEALEKIKAALGKGLFPSAMTRVEDILKDLETDSFEAGFERAKETVTEWHKPLSY